MICTGRLLPSDLLESYQNYLLQNKLYTFFCRVATFNRMFLLSQLHLNRHQIKSFLSLGCTFIINLYNKKITFSDLIYSNPD